MFWKEFDMWKEFKIALSMIIDPGLKVRNGLFSVSRSHNQLNYILKIQNHLLSSGNICPIRRRHLSKVQFSWEFPPIVLLDMKNMVWHGDNWFCPPICMKMPESMC